MDQKIERGVVYTVAVLHYFGGIMCNKLRDNNCSRCNVLGMWGHETSAASAVVLRGRGGGEAKTGSDGTGAIYF